MTRRDEMISMQHVIAPRSIALFGASEDYAKFGGRITHHLVSHGYQGKIYAINSKRYEVLGLPCYPSVSDLPEAPDMVLLAVPVSGLEEAVTACGESGVGVCVIITAQLGEFSEEGKALEERLVRIAHDHNMRLVGPNCMGMIVPSADMALSSTPTLRYSPAMPKGRVALISQSGAFMGLLYLTAFEHGVGLSGMVSIGNQADLEMCDFLEAFIDRDDTEVICLYVEGLKSPDRFRDLALRARAAGKRILAVKAGRTEAGSVMARSHTSSMAGSYSAFEALCRETGVLLLDEPDSMVLCAGVLASNPRASGPRIGIVGASGGTSAIMADRLTLGGLEFASYADATRTRLSKAYKPHHQNNPLDIGAHFGVLDAAHFCESIDTVFEDPNVGIFVYSLTPQPLMDETVDHLIQVWSRQEKPVVVVLNLHNFGESHRRRLLDAGMPFVTRQDDLFRVLRLLAGEDAADAAVRDTEATRPADQPIYRTEQVGFLTEPEAKEVLRVYGVPVPSATLTEDAEAAVAAAEAMGYPVVLKGVVADIVHKSDLGLVRVGLKDEAALRAAWHDIRTAIAAAAPEATPRIDVQQMIGTGVELILGLKNENGFGPQIILGAGGIHVEVLKDVVQMRAPVTPQEVRGMMERLRIWPLLSGVRSQDKPAIEAACEDIARLSWLAVDLGDRLEDFEVNPLRITADGVYALDGRGTLVQPA